MEHIPMTRSAIPPIQAAANVAAIWEDYQGETAWTKSMREFGSLGGLVQYWCGMPRCASSIPLTFALFAPDGTKLECSYRLKDIHAAIATLKTASQ
jgi:hypothetical protein